MTSNDTAKKILIYYFKALEEFYSFEVISESFSDYLKLREEANENVRLKS